VTLYSLVDVFCFGPILSRRVKIKSFGLAEYTVSITDVGSVLFRIRCVVTEYTVYITDVGSVLFRIRCVVTEYTVYITDVGSVLFRIRCVVTVTNCCTLQNISAQQITSFLL
jgi:hypothetical protein